MTTSVRQRTLIALFLGLMVAGRGLAQTPGGWDGVERKSLQMIIDGKAVEAVALLQTFVTAHPDVGLAHGMLASAHSAAAEALDSAGPAAASSRNRHLQNAALHYRRTIELTHVNRLLNLLGVDLYDRVYHDPKLSPAEARRLILVAVAAFDQRHWLLTQYDRADRPSAV